MEVNVIEEETYSQLGQDLWVLEDSKYLFGGYFVDFGATDGKTINNTYLLEKNFGWIGILSEPNPKYHKILRKNRPDSTIDHRLVFSRTGEILKFILHDDLSTIAGYGQDDEHHEARKTGEICSVLSISLYDLLEKYKAPRVIDYLSIDTEGSEYDILEAFFHNPNPYGFIIDRITVEHNYTAQREKIKNLLENFGYERVKEQKWDDFYKLKKV